MQFIVIILNKDDKDDKNDHTVFEGEGGHGGALLEKVKLKRVRAFRKCPRLKACIFSWNIEFSLIKGKY